MKFFHAILLGGVFLTRLHALESAEIAAVAKRFDAPTGDEQYQARIELNRLVAQATIPGKGDCAAVTKLLIAALQAPETSKEASKYLLRALARIGTVEAVAPLAKILAGQDPMLKEEARAALSWIRNPQAVAVLEAALAKAVDPRAKISLLNALASQQSASSVPLLAPLMAAGDPELARAALTAIARIGGPAAVTALTTASAKVPAALKPDAERALLVASAGDARTAMLIYQSSSSATIKLAAFLALMQSAPDSAKPGLIEAALKSADPDLRHAALACGLETRLPSLQATLAKSFDQMPKDDRLIVLANIRQLQPAAAAEKIALSRIASAEEDERVSAITALGNFPTPSAFHAVLEALGVREPRINQAAANAIANMTYPAAETTLLAMLKGNSSPDKILALKAMVSRQVPEASAILLFVIKGADKDASKEAMKTLYFTASIDDLRSLCAATAATQDPDLHKGLVSICSRIATRIKTPEALALVKDLK